MASAMFTEEVNDLVSCPVCFFEYDDLIESRKPKCLPCSHILCFQCLKNITNWSSLVCPICMKVCSYSSDVSSLPNNSCKTITSPDCTFYHPTMDVTPNVLSGHGTLVSINQVLARLRLEPAVPTNRPKTPKIIFAFKHRGVEMGQVEFEPSEVHNTAFTSILAEFQLHRDDSLSRELKDLDMALPGSFVTARVLLTRDLESRIWFDGAVPRSPGDVGIFNTDVSLNYVSLWNFFFTLDEFDGPNTTVKHRKTMKSAALLGRITKGMDTLKELSKLNEIEMQFCKFSIESI